VGPQLAGDVSGEAQRFLVQVLADEVLQPVRISTTFWKR
jgi:hypothetical protein